MYVLEAPSEHTKVTSRPTPAGHFVVVIDQPHNILRDEIRVFFSVFSPSEKSEIDHEGYYIRGVTVLVVLVSRVVAAM